MPEVRTIAQWEMDKQRGESDPAKRRRDAYIPEHLRACTWADYDDTAATKDFSLKEYLVAYCEEWSPATQTGAVLLGPAGYGKTFGTVLTAMDLMDRGAWVKYVPYAQLVERRKKLIGLERQAERDDDWSAANAAAYRLRFIEEECDVLFLDDVGKEYRAASGWSDDGLDLLLRRRRELSKVTFISSNLKHADWVTYNESMASFLYEVGDVLQLTEGRDHRVRRSDLAKRLGRGAR